MNQPRPLLSNHQRKRLTLWALAVLGWLMDVLTGAREISVRQLNQRFHHLWLEDLKRVAITVLVVRALQFSKLRVRRGVQHWKHGRSLRRAHFIRSVLGARLRRQLKHKDLKTRVAQLIALLRNLDTHARHLAKRLRSMTRLWRKLPPIAAPTLILGPPAPSPAAVNSS